MKGVVRGSGVKRIAGEHAVDESICNTATRQHCFDEEHRLSALCQDGERLSLAHWLSSGSRIGVINLQYPAAT